MRHEAWLNGVAKVSVSMEGDTPEQSAIVQRALFWRERLLTRLGTIQHPKLEEALEFASVILATLGPDDNDRKNEAILELAVGAILRHGNSTITVEKLSALFDKAEEAGIPAEKLSMLAVGIREIFNPSLDGRRSDNRRYGSRG